MATSSQPRKTHGSEHVQVLLYAHEGRGCRASTPCDGRHSDARERAISAAEEAVDSCSSTGQKAVLRRRVGTVSSPVAPREALLRQGRGDELQLNSRPCPGDGALHGREEWLNALPFQSLVLRRAALEILPGLIRFGGSYVRVNTVPASWRKARVNDAGNANDHHVVWRFDGRLEAAENGKVQWQVLRNLVGTKAQVHVHERVGCLGRRR
mmetsp:Transcript_53054/g.114739  ORF Transcript_53054/g.114739 Transcript_53054/m.114739 type:complete len:210 (+) Transcript_53054:161-790(+)